MRLISRIIFLILVAILFTSCIHYSQAIEGIINSKRAWFFCWTGLLLVFSAFALVKQGFSFRINKLDLIVCLFFLHTILNNYFHDSLLLSRRNYEAAGLLLFYLLLKKFVNQNWLRYFEVSFLVLTFFQVGLAFLQWFGLLPSVSAFFKIAGLFANPGSFAVYLTALMAFDFALFCFSESKVIRLLSLALLLLSLPVILILYSRAAWVGGIMSIAFIIETKYCFFRRLVKFHKTSLKVVAILTLVVMILSSYFLIQLRKDSVDGRMLIWKLSGEVIRDFPMEGVGSANFPAMLFKYQSHYFQIHPDRISTEGRLADETWFAFNDVLQLTAEQGITGLCSFAPLLLLLSGMSISLIRERSRLAQHGALVIGSMAVLLSVFVSSLFSYPLTLLPFKILVFCLIAILSSCYDRTSEAKLVVVNVSRKIRVAVALVLTAVGFHFSILGVNLFSGYRDWFSIEASRFQNSKISWLVVKYPFLCEDPLYRIRLGNELLSNSKFDEAISVFESAKSISSNRNLYYSLGMAYKLSNEMDKAEEQYKFLEYALPNHVRPKYMLAKLYYDTKQNEKWQKKSDEVVKFIPKVESIATQTMIKEIKSLMNGRK